MRISALHTARLASELKSELTGAEIAKLHKSESDKRIIIQVGGDKGLSTLVFHFGGGTPYLYLRHGYTAKIATTNFLPQLMGGKITSIAQIGFDRIIRMGIAISEQVYSLIFEFFGQNSNLLFLDNHGRIITSLKKSKAAGDVYHPPTPPEFLNPLDFNPSLIADEFISAGDQSLRNLMTSRFAGVDDDLVMIIKDDLGLNLLADSDKMDRGQIVQALNELRRMCREFVAGGRIAYLIDPPVVLVKCKEGYEKADSLSEIFYRFSSQTSVGRKVKSARTEALSLVKRALKKETRKLEKLRTQLEKAEEHANLQKAAELLSMNMHKLKSGMESVEVEDVYSEGIRKIKIELIRSYSPGKNIERLFAKARKLRDKIPGIKQEQKISGRRFENLEAVGLRIEACKLEDLTDDIKAALAELGLAKPEVKRKKKTYEPERVPYKQYTSTLGETILVGRTARDNDVLTFKVARKHDLWFHSQQTSGSHVILRRPDRKHQFQKSSIMEAAAIAAFFSSAKNSESVPVIYTEVKYIRKLRKGKPGQVLADRTKSVLVTPRKP